MPIEKGDKVLVVTDDRITVRMIKVPERDFIIRTYDDYTETVRGVVLDGDYGYTSIEDVYTKEDVLSMLESMEVEE